MGELSRHSILILYRVIKLGEGLDWVEFSIWPKPIFVNTDLRFVINDYRLEHISAMIIDSAVSCGQNLLSKASNTTRIHVQ